MHNLIFICLSFVNLFLLHVITVKCDKSYLFTSFWIQYSVYMYLNTFHYYSKNLQTILFWHSTFDVNFKSSHFVNTRLIIWKTASLACLRSPTFLSPTLPTLSINVTQSAASAFAELRRHTLTFTDSWRSTRILMFIPSDLCLPLNGDRNESLLYLRQFFKH